MKEYFTFKNDNNSSFKQYFSNIKTKLYDSSIEIKPDFLHLDYYPLVIARVHTVGDKIQHWALNKDLRETYDKFL